MYCSFKFIYYYKFISFFLYSGFPALLGGDWYNHAFPPRVYFPATLLPEIVYPIFELGTNIMSIPIYQFYSSNWNIYFIKYYISRDLDLDK